MNDIVEQRYQALRGRLLDADGLADLPEPEPLVAGYLYRDSLAWLSGKPGHGKSLAALDIACNIGAGMPWHGHDVTPGKVLYLVA